jgi:CMP-N-acetylneuraminic acid synthetase
MSKHIKLTIDDISKLALDDFLKVSPDEDDPLTTDVTMTEDAINPSDKCEDKETPTEKPNVQTYFCQNPDCPYLNHREVRECLHIFEIDDTESIVICNQCYDNGYRFCLYTHEVMHQNKLQQVLGNMYAQPAINQHQLDSDRMTHIDDVYNYLKMIGIDNPNPEHTIIALN